MSTADENQKQFLQDQLEILNTELKNLIQYSIELKNKVLSAKTAVKKDYFTRKLHKNNKTMYDAMCLHEIVSAQIEEAMITTEQQ